MADNMDQGLVKENRDRESEVIFNFLTFFFIKLGGLLDFSKTCFEKYLQLASLLHTT